MSKLVFCTFGCNSFEYSRLRLAKQAVDSNWFDLVCAYGKNDTIFSKPDGHFNGRGGGYWWWKPYILRSTLEKMNYGDILLYLDAGFYLNSRGKRLFNYYKNLISNHQVKVLAFRCPEEEKIYTKRDLFKILDCDTPEYSESKQLASGYFFLKKDDTVLKMIDEFMSLSDFIHLFNDNPSFSPNYEGFSEHRHDQSILSLLIKKYFKEHSLIIENSVPEDSGIDYNYEIMLCNNYYKHNGLNNLNILNHPFLSARIHDTHMLTINAQNEMISDFENCLYQTVIINPDYNSILKNFVENLTTKNIILIGNVFTMLKYFDNFDTYFDSINIRENPDITTPNEIIILYTELLNNVTFTELENNKQYIEHNLAANLIRYRLDNNLPFKIIYDVSYENNAGKEVIEFYIKYFEYLGVDVENNLLIILDGAQSNYVANSNNVLVYSQLAVDGLYWKTIKPEKFTNLNLTKRPNLINLTLSKMIQKKSRVEILYEFYKKNALNKCLLSSFGKIEEIKLHINDNDFICEMNERLSNIGGEKNILEEGYSNKEFCNETSDRNIFNNSILCCVLETAFCDTSTNTWHGNNRVTEKFYKCIINKTPFIIFGQNDAYEKINYMGYNSFDSIINTEFVTNNDCKNKIIQYVSEAINFLEIIPNQMNEVQEICNHNYEKFIFIANHDKKKYIDRIKQFINI